MDDPKIDQETDVSQIRELVLHIDNPGERAERLIEYFRHPDYEVRRRACSAANKLHKKEITKYLELCLYAPEPQVRHYALKAVLSSRCHFLVDQIKEIIGKEEKEYNILLFRKILQAAGKWNSTGNGHSKQIVCLATSRKYGGYCIAGKGWSDGQVGPWIRPVSTREYGELSPEEIRLGNGHKPQCLDVITIETLGVQKHPYQRGNVLIAEARPWTWQCKLPLVALPNLVDDVDHLWQAGFHSANGLNDRIPEETVRKSKYSSIYLIRPNDFTLLVSVDPDGRKKVRAKFTYRTIPYLISVTHPGIEKMYLMRKEGEYPLNTQELYLIVSMSEPFNGYCYKLAAAIIL